MSGIIKIEVTVISRSRRLRLLKDPSQAGSVENAECGVRSAECGVRSAECGVRSAECGVRSVENAECGKRGV